MIIDKLIIDVDGVLTSGHMLYNNLGKTFKVFGPHDRDGLKLISKYINDITFITADKTGFDITYARIVTDWKYRDDQLVLVPEESRLEWFIENCNFNTTAYIADGYHDAVILKKVALGIAPKSARIEARTSAKYVTPSDAASGAVLDACLYIEKMIKGWWWRQL
jgi:3-deoxy-D-manno-octulosonate 8-phosphate phosphatase (KDO 8-P phosphatase)